jgi:PAS domain S-box-containing protein
MNKRRLFYMLPVMLILVVVASGWYATIYLGNKARQEIIGESQASVLTLSIYVSSTFKSIEGAVKSLAGSPWIAPALLSKGEPDIEQANSVLDRYNSAIDASVSYLMDAGGMTLASSNRRDPDSFVGQPYGFRPYFQDALHGLAGHYYAIGVTSGKRGFYVSYPVRNPSGEVIGVVAMKKNLDEIEPFFSKYPFCFLASPDGIVFLSSKPAMVTKSLWPLDKAVREKLLASRQFGDNFSEAVVNKEIVDGTEIAFERNNYWASRKVISRDGWSIVLLTPTDRIGVYRLIGILATIFLCILIMVFSAVIYVTNRSKEIFRQSEESKRLLLHAVGDGIFGVDTTGQVTFINPAALRMLGFAEEEMLHQNVHSLIHHSHNDGSDYPIEDCPMFAACNHAGYSHVPDEVLWRKDGSSFPVDYSSMPITKDGKVMGVVVSFKDITERKQAEEALRNSETTLSLLLETIPIPVFYKDENGRYLGFNNAYEVFFGKSKEQLIGKSVFDISPPELAKVYHAKDAELFKKPGVQVYDSQVLDANGVLHNVIFHKASLTDAQGSVTGLIGAVLDITEQKRAEEEIQQYSTELEKNNKELRKALSEIKQLSGMLPICSYCKKIRDDKGYWNQIESYIHEHSEATFSHGICQDCAKKYFPDIDLYAE